MKNGAFSGILAGIVGAAALTFSSCVLTPSGIASKYGIPSDPFNGIALDVVDATNAYYPDSSAEMFWDLHLSASEWANQLSQSIYIFEPNNSNSLTLQNETVLTDSSGNYTDVEGMSEDTSTDSATFGTYQVAWQLYQGGSSNTSTSIYTDNFTADAPNGQSQGTYYTAAASTTPVFADAATFSMTMYSNGLAISLVSGSLSSATSLEFDFYANASAAAPLAVLVLDSSAIAQFASSTATQPTILVQPSDLATVYTNNSATTSTAWIGLSYSSNSPNPTAAYQTEYDYASYFSPSTSNSTNDSTSADPNAATVDVPVSVGAISASMVGGKGSSFTTAAQGAKPFLPNEFKKK